MGDAGARVRADPGGVRPVRFRAAGHARLRAPRRAARQVRGRRRQTDLQDPAPRRARGQRRGRPGAAIRPHGAAGPGRRRVRKPVAHPVQAVRDRPGLARGPARPGPLPRVRPVRPRHAGDRVDDGRRGGHLRGARRARRTRPARVRVPAQLPPGAGRPARCVQCARGAWPRRPDHPGQAGQARARRGDRRTCRAGPARSAGRRPGRRADRRSQGQRRGRGRAGRGGLAAVPGGRSGAGRPGDVHAPAGARPQLLHRADLGGGRRGRRRLAGRRRALRPPD